ncbi:unnamed protein product [Schistosoma intercalatum]|nr:unnamed protein product [Schistosoma intercalatum]
MPISDDQLNRILQQQQAQLDAQMRMLETVTQQLNIHCSNSHAISSTSCDAVASSIPEFIYDPESGNTFLTWFKRWEDTFRTEFCNQDDAWKTRLLVRKLGSSEHARFADHILPKLPRELSFEETVFQLSEIFGESSSLFSIRYRCLNLVKREADEYGVLADIVNRECERFKLRSLTDDQFKCLIFIKALQSPQDAEIRTRLLARLDQDPNVTLRTLTDECKRLQSIRHDNELIEQVNPNLTCGSVNTITRLKVQKPVTTRNKPRTACWLCGDWHYARFCPFKKHKCQECNKRGPKRTSQPKKKHKRPRHVKSAESKSLSLVAAFQTNYDIRRKYVTIQINSISARLQIDTASDIMLVSRETYNLLGKPPMKPSKKTAKNASGGVLKLVGELQCEFSFNGTNCTGICYLTERPNLDLLGLDMLDKLGIMDIPINSVCNVSCSSLDTPLLPKKTGERLLEKLKRKFASVFQNSLGHCTKMKAHLPVKPDAIPIFRPRRPVPYAALELVDQELNRLQQAGVIRPVNYSAWAAPIVVIKKANGTIRICADFSTGLNAALDVYQYPLPVPEDLFAKLNGGTCFAKIDFSDAYLQVEVDEDSRELLTINTHRGLFQYTRLPFGIKTAPAIFQQIMDTMLTGIPGTAAYLDDIIVMGSTDSELSDRLHQVLNRVLEYGFQLREEKCIFFMHSIKYLGFILDKNGRRPDPANIEAIQKMPAPTDVSSLRSFLGLISHYSTFLPEMHRVRGPLNELLSKDKPWQWSAECQASFDRVKSMLSSKILLTHFDPSLEIVVASDASSHGVGAVISHVFPDKSEKTIAHAARSLTPAERNYSQIEKEALAIIFAVKRFHKMLYGRTFTLLTDHKPLIAIFGSKKGIPVYTANRLQRWATMLLSYDFNIKYQSTNTIGQADALSRLIGVQHPGPEDIIIASTAVDPEIRSIVADAIRNTPVSSDEVREETFRDPTLQEVRKFHLEGWPSKIYSTDLQQFYQRRLSLSIIDDCLLFAERVIIPKKLQPAVLEQLHAGHPGINRMKALARSYVYWPHLDTQLEQLSRSCTKGALATKAPRKAELQSCPIPQSPWQRIHLDFAGPLHGQTYLLVVDAYSKWPEIFLMEHPTASCTVSKLRQLFSRFGIPELIVSDNGTQFTSEIFSQFCRQNGIQHIRTPPYHPQSNGQVERFVSTFKNALKKSKGEGTTEDILERFLFIYRSTPNPQTINGLSPAEALLGRKIRTHFDVIRPTPAIEPQRNLSMEKQFNRHHGAQRRLFTVGQKVLAMDYRGKHPTWTAGRILKKKGSVVYEVSVGSEVWVRHANQLKATSIASNKIQYRLPLDVLLDTFEIKTPGIDTSVSVQEKSDTSLLPRRWTNRKHRPVTRLQLDPSTRSYESAQRGGVSGT